MRYRNVALFLVLSVVWGSAFTAIKVGLEYFPPVLFAALRYDVAGVLMLGYALLVTDRWRPVSRAEWRVVGVGALLVIGGYHALLFVGEQQTTSAAAAVIVGLSPVATTAFARVLLPHERLSAVGVLGLLVGLGGVVVLARPDPANLFGGDAVGEWLVFGAAVSFALGSVLTRRIDADLPVETMEAWSMLGGALAMHAASLAIGERVAAVRPVPEAIAALGYLAVVASALGFLVYFDLLDRLGPVEINLVSYAAPVAAAVTGVAVLGEVPTVRTAVGFLAVCCGFVLVKRDALAREVSRLRAARRGA
jgi:drug/metabolite transporter (DMT)-like permease